MAIREAFDGSIYSMESSFIAHPPKRVKISNLFSPIQVVLQPPDSPVWVSEAHQRRNDTRWVGAETAKNRSVIRGKTAYVAPPLTLVKVWTRAWTRPSCPWTRSHVVQDRFNGDPMTLTIFMLIRSFSIDMPYEYLF